MAEVLEIAGRRWIAGLRWRDCPPRPKLAALREIGDGLGMSWVAPRTQASISQAGFCEPVRGERVRGLYSLTAAIAAAFPQPWIGVYQIAQNKWLFVAVRDHHGILPRGDVIGDETAIAEAQKEYENYSGWEFYKGTLADLEPLLRDGRAQKRLFPVRSLEPISPWRVIGPPALGVGVAVGGVLLWNHHEAAVRKAREARLAAQRAKEEAAQRAISPLKRTPAPAEWLAACRSAVTSVPLSVDGWAVSGVTCGSHVARVVWKRGPGATVRSKPKGTITGQGNKIQETIRFPTLRAGPDNAAGLQASETALYGVLQAMGVQGQISRSKARRALPGARSTHKVKPIPTAQAQFTLPIPPWDVSFSMVPGLRLHSARRVRNGWQVKGALYGR